MTATEWSMVTTAIAAIIARYISGVSSFLGLSGDLASAASIGSKLYLISDLLTAFAAPTLNNALLTVLFFKYHEQEGSIAELSPTVFRDRRGNTATRSTIPAA